MLAAGPAKKVTVYVNEDAKSHHRPMHQAILEFLMKSGVSGATAMRAMAGFGGHHVLHTPRIEVLAEHLPILVEFVESPQKVEELMPALTELVTDGMIEVQDTTVVKSVPH
jgi:PII-like signaling protein